MKHLFTLLSIGFCLLTACGTSENVEELPTYTENGHLQAIIEIPAGTNRKVIYAPTSRNFVVEQKFGEDRVIDFLPYPANYGFIPSTRVHSEKGGDGDPLDVFILAESLPSAVSIEVIPIALIETEDNGELDPKLLAVPAAESRQIVDAQTLGELEKTYPAVKDILTLWLTNYDPADSVRVLNWKNEEEAKQAVKSWSLDQ